MKPCSSNRKLIAWLALGALDAGKAAALRDHLADCPGCRCYWEEISNVTETLASAQPDSNLEASECFYRKVAVKHQAVETGSVLEDLAAWLRGSILDWRVSLPAIAVLAIAALAMVTPRHHPAASASAPPAAQAVSASDSDSDLAPTIGNYQMVANQSLEKLSELLTRQGNKNLPPVPIYTASSLTFADEPF
jgi:hypothetical protein